MERIIIDKSRYIPISEVDFFEGIVLVYRNDTLIGSIVPVTGGLRIATIFEDTVLDNLDDIIDAFFDYTFKYITNE